MDVTALTFQSVRSCKIITWVSWVSYVHRVVNIYCQDRIYPLIKSKHSLKNVTKMITENCNLVDTKLSTCLVIMMGECDLRNERYNHNSS